MALGGNGKRAAAAAATATATVVTAVLRMVLMDNGLTMMLSELAVQQLTG